MSSCRILTLPFFFRLASVFHLNHDDGDQRGRTKETMGKNSQEHSNLILPPTAHASPHPRGHILEIHADNMGI